VSLALTQTTFTNGGHYTLTVTIDKATKSVPLGGGYYSNAITSVIFDYESGKYRCEATGHGDVEVLNDDRSSVTKWSVGIGSHEPAVFYRVRSE
jgi:hypothetical protein